MPARNSRDLRALDSGPLAFEPRTEQGVVALFAGICEDEYGLRIVDIETRYPDCYAKNRAGREIGIEFEYESSRFNHTEAPRRTPSGSRGHCELVVCWIDNAKRGEKWRKRLKVIELSALRRFAELGPRVWLQPYSRANVDQLRGRKRHVRWTVPSQAQKGDLLLVYRSGPAAAITHIMELTRTAEFDRKHGWGRGFQADLKTVVELPNPVSRADLRANPELANMSYLKRPTPLGQEALKYWPAIERCLLERNPRAGIKNALAPFRPKPQRVATIPAE